MPDNATIEELRSEIERLKPLAELGMMAATVAHEVRNPLAGISANAELLRECLGDPDDVESVDIILNEVSRLSNLVNELLQYSRETRPSTEPIDLVVLARRVRDLHARHADEAGVSVLVQGGGHAEGDYELALQALLNVVRNAVQACRTGGTVTMQLQDDAVCVIDEGCGVPEDIRERIFDPFVTGKTRGLGLGVAVARRCMRRQQGELLLEATGETGSTFALRWGVGQA